MFVTVIGLLDGSHDQAARAVGLGLIIVGFLGASIQGIGVRRRGRPPKAIE